MFKSALGEVPVATWLRLTAERDWLEPLPEDAGLAYRRLKVEEHHLGADDQPKAAVVTRHLAQMISRPSGPNGGKRPAGYRAGQGDAPDRCVVQLHHDLLVLMRLAVAHEVEQGPKQLRLLRRGRG